MQRQFKWRCDARKYNASEIASLVYVYMRREKHFFPSLIFFLRSSETRESVLSEYTASDVTALYSYWIASKWSKLDDNPKHNVKEINFCIRRTNGKTLSRVNRNILSNVCVCVRVSSLSDIRYRARDLAIFVS